MTARANVATIDDADVTGRRVLLRVDFNVPMKDGTIVDDRRIRAALPTIQALRDRGARVIVATHLGRPKSGPDTAYSTAPLAERLSELIEAPVQHVGDVVGDEALAMSRRLGDGEVGMIENVRFELGETKNDTALAQSFAMLADIYCNDAFGAAHRAHSSTEGVARCLPAYAGYLMAREVSTLSGIFDNPARPLAGIIGGAKISSKLGVVTTLLETVDTLWICGAMACTFYRALGYTTGTSLVEEDQIDVARKLHSEATKSHAELRIPVDVVIAREATAGAETQVVAWDAIPDGWMVVDAGPRTVEQMAETCREAATIVWNGPLGIYEIPDFARGTTELARAVAAAPATTIIGGGDLAAAVDAAGVADQISFVSTGGGATLEFLEGVTLPGVAALRTRDA